MTPAQVADITSDPAIRSLTAAGYTLEITQRQVVWAWYAELRRPDGRHHEGGYGLTLDAALRHLGSRLARQEGPA